MGLRDEKKRRTRERIIENAIALFREQGFDATRVRDIARPLELSDATFFNYFASKDAVLSAWLDSLSAAAFERAAQSHAGRARTLARAAARDLASALSDDAALLSGAWHRVRLPGVPVAATAALEAGQTDGELRRDLPAAQLAEILIAGLFASAGGWLASWRELPEGNAERDPRALARRLQSVVDLVLDGSRRRNERVRAPATSSRTGLPAPRP